MKAKRPVDRYREWKLKRPDVGCVFARYMASRPKEFGQRTLVLPGKDPAKLAAVIAAQTAAAIEAPEANAVAFVLPEVRSLRTLARIALELSAQPGWAVKARLLKKTPAGKVVALNVVRHIPMGTTTCPSETLMLGPFRVFPKTRRAPVAALEVFVGKPPPYAKDGTPTQKAHLALVPMHGLPSASTFETMWRNTEKGRLASLGGKDDHRAKAKVALVMPVSLATALGCMP